MCTILAIFCFVLSSKYLYNSIAFLSLDNNKFIDNIILCFSNFMISILFFDVLIGAYSHRKLNLSIYLGYSMLLYVTIAFCVFMNNLLEVGLYSGESLFYQILAFLIFIFTIIYIVRMLSSLNNKKKETFESKQE
jgi:hypothetical protein